MPVFKAHIPAGRFSSAQKRALADALNQSLLQGLGIPEGDRFVILSEHGPDELFLHPTFMGMERDPASAMIITVLIGAHRPIEDKSKLVAAINRLVVRSEEPTSELQSLMRSPYAVFCLKQNKTPQQ